MGIPAFPHSFLSKWTFFPQQRYVHVHLPTSVSFQPPKYPPFNGKFMGRIWKSSLLKTRLFPSIHSATYFFAHFSTKISLAIKMLTYLFLWFFFVNFFWGYFQIKKECKNFFHIRLKPNLLFLLVPWILLMREIFLGLLLILCPLLFHTFSITIVSHSSRIFWLWWTPPLHLHFRPQGYLMHKSVELMMGPKS